jgi:tRNA-specific 2-thiouridylase
MSRVVVGLSGGVDSSVAAYLLKEAGHEVIGMFMRNWHDESVIIDDECPWIEDSNDAMLVADKLDIPYQVIDLSEEYKERIVDYMFAEYEAGRTPNPDVLCNREIKFDVFLKAAMQLGADYVATGHYCQKEEIDKDGEKIYRLLGGADPNKDQSYFLCQVTQEQLSKVLFPIGHLQKSEVREIARREGLVTAEKKDSQGLCFVGKVRLPDFLQQQLKAKEGDIFEIPADSPIYKDRKDSLTYNAMVKSYEYEVEDGKHIGTHIGAHFFTIGQRRGLAVGGTKEALFVIGTDVENNIIYVGQGNDHPGLWRKGLFVRASEVHWVRPDMALGPGAETTYDIRIRYRQPLSEAKLILEEEGLYVIFKDELSAVTPGQFIAWYRDGELIGSGTIS